MKNKSKIAVCFLLLLTFIAGSTFNIWQPLKFFVCPTLTTIGKNFSRYQAVARTHIKYSYDVDNVSYMGDTSVLLYLNKDSSNHILIRYLIQDPTISMIDSLIGRELVVNSIQLLILTSLFVWLNLAILGKLPKKNQNHFNIFINS